MKTAAVVLGALLLVVLFFVSAEAAQEDLDSNTIRVLLQDELEVSGGAPAAAPADSESEIAKALDDAEGPVSEDEVSGSEYGIHASRWLTVLSAIAMLYLTL
ncbi:hypothetical protein BSKO_07788 [Bryopsis sp. KO-2023]|nr:hypothetical protein BSKO_07788 [Bryopsis sp. KO-2023]